MDRGIEFLINVSEDNKILTTLQSNSELIYTFNKLLQENLGIEFNKNIEHLWDDVDSLIQEDKKVNLIIFKNEDEVLLNFEVLSGMNGILLLLGCGIVPNSFLLAKEKYDEALLNYEEETNKITITGNSLSGAISQYISVISENDFANLQCITYDGVGIKSLLKFNGNEFFGYQLSIIDYLKYCSDKNSISNILLQNLRKAKVIVEGNIAKEFRIAKGTSINEVRIKEEILKVLSIGKEAEEISKIYEFINANFNAKLIEDKMRLIDCFNKFKERVEETEEENILNYISSKNFLSSTFQNIGKCYYVDNRLRDGDKGYTEGFYNLIKTAPADKLIDLTSFHKDLFLPFINKKENGNGERAKTRSGNAPIVGNVTDGISDDYLKAILKDIINDLKTKDTTILKDIYINYKKDEEKDFLEIIKDRLRFSINNNTVREFKSKYFKKNFDLLTETEKKYKLDSVLLENFRRMSKEDFYKLFEWLIKDGEVFLKIGDDLEEGEEYIFYHKTENEPGITSEIIEIPVELSDVSINRIYGSKITRRVDPTLDTEYLRGEEGDSYKFLMNKGLGYEVKSENTDVSKNIYIDDTNLAGTINRVIEIPENLVDKVTNGIKLYGESFLFANQKTLIYYYGENLDNKLTIENFENGDYGINLDETPAEEENSEDVIEETEERTAEQSEVEAATTQAAENNQSTNDQQNDQAGDDAAANNAAAGAPGAPAVPAVPVPGTKFIATMGGIQIQRVPGVGPFPVPSGLQSPNVMVEGKPAFMQQITFTSTSPVYPGMTGCVGTGSIPTMGTTNIMINGKPAILTTDMGQCNGMGMTTTPIPSPAPCMCMATIIPTSGMTVFANGTMSVAPAMGGAGAGSGTAENFQLEQGEAGQNEEEQAATAQEAAAQEETTEEETQIQLSTLELKETEGEVTANAAYCDEEGNLYPNFQLPELATAIYDNGKKEKVKVTWDREVTLDELLTPDVDLTYTATYKSLSATFTLKVVKAKWNILVYIAADNNLSEYGKLDMDELIDGYAGLNKDKVNIIYFYDGAVGEDSAYYKVFTKGDKTLASYLPFKNIGQMDYGIKIQELGEADTGQVSTCTDFLDYVTEKYPAENYVFNLWGHGGGIMGGLTPDDDGGAGASTYLTAVQIKDVTNHLMSAIGKKIDVFGIDACVMGMLEIAHDIKDDVSYYIASQETIQQSGWNYRKLIYDVCYKIDITAEELAKEIVNNYKERYEGLGPGTGAFYPKRKTLSAIKLDAIGNVTSKFGEVVASFIDKMEDLRSENPKKYKETLKNIQKAILSENHKQFYAGTHSDLLSITGLLDGEKLQEMKDVLNEAVIAKVHEDGAGGCGLSVWNGYYVTNEASGEVAKSKQTIDGFYEGLSFVSDTSWDEGITRIHGSVNKCEVTKENGLEIEAKQKSWTDYLDLAIFEENQVGYNDKKINNFNYECYFNKENKEYIQEIIIGNEYTDGSQLLPLYSFPEYGRLNVSRYVDDIVKVKLQKDSQDLTEEMISADILEEGEYTYQIIPNVVAGEGNTYNSSDIDKINEYTSEMTIKVKKADWTCINYVSNIEKFKKLVIDNEIFKEEDENNNLLLNIENNFGRNDELSGIKDYQDFEKDFNENYLDTKEFKSYIKDLKLFPNEYEEFFKEFSLKNFIRNINVLFVVKGDIHSDIYSEDLNVYKFVYDINKRKPVLFKVSGTGLNNDSSFSEVLSYLKTTYLANHYLLNMIGHSYGLKGIGETNTEFVSITELSGALDVFGTYSLTDKEEFYLNDHGLDILISDSSFKNLVEINYELMGKVKYHICADALCEIDEIKYNNLFYKIDISEKNFKTKEEFYNVTISGILSSGENLNSVNLLEFKEKLKEINEKIKDYNEYLNNLEIQDWKNEREDYIEYLEKINIENGLENIEYFKLEKFLEYFNQKIDLEINLEETIFKNMLISNGCNFIEVSSSETSNNQDEIIDKLEFSTSNLDYFENLEINNTNEFYWRDLMLILYNGEVDKKIKIRDISLKSKVYKGYLKESFEDSLNNTFEWTNIMYFSSHDEFKRELIEEKTFENGISNLLSKNTSELKSDRKSGLVFNKNNFDEMKRKTLNKTLNDISLKKGNLIIVINGDVNKKEIYGINNLKIFNCLYDSKINRVSFKDLNFKSERYKVGNPYHFSRIISFIKEKMKSEKYVLSLLGHLFNKEEESNDLYLTAKSLKEGFTVLKETEENDGISENRQGINLLISTPFKTTKDIIKSKGNPNKIKQFLGINMFILNFGYTNPLEWLHYYRNKWNKEVSFGMVYKEKWTMLSGDKSVFHRVGEGGENNLKFVSPKGLYEAVFKVINQRMVLDISAIDGGTFNLFTPFNDWGHGIADVVPYYSTGNSFEDRIDFWSRIKASMEAKDFIFKYKHNWDILLELKETLNRDEYLMLLEMYKGTEAYEKELELGSKVKRNKEELEL